MKKQLLYCLLIISGQLMATNHFNETEQEDLKRIFHEEVDEQCAKCNEYLKNPSTVEKIFLDQCEKKKAFLNQSEQDFLEDYEAQQEAMAVINEIVESPEYKNNSNKSKYRRMCEDIINAHRKKLESRDLDEQKKEKLVRNFLIYVHFMRHSLNKFNIN